MPLRARENPVLRFPVGRWLDKEEDDGRISLELEPNKKPASKATAGQYLPSGVSAKHIITLYFQNQRNQQSIRTRVSRTLSERCYG